MFKLVEIVMGDGPSIRHLQTSFLFIYLFTQYRENRILNTEKLENRIFYVSFYFKSHDIRRRQKCGRMWYVKRSNLLIGFRTAEGFLPTVDSV